jgi:radical SAM superfamily enzyme YgiQ (UPF0313 family)
MRVLLINPPLDPAVLKGLRKSIYRSLFYNSAPLGIAYLGAVLLREGYDVDLVDSLVEEYSFEQALKRILAFKPDVVGITSTSISYRGSVILARAIKRELPRIPVLIGGSHVSANPRSTVLEKAFDAGCIGEGEITLLEYLEAYRRGSDLGEVDGLVFRRNGEVHVCRPRRPIEDLDTIPIPARHFFPIERYRPIPVDNHGLPKLSIISSRGCPYGCIFCDKSVFGQRYRSFSVKRIGDELESLVRDFGARDLAFLDSTFNVIAERARRISDEILSRNLNLTWTCSLRVNTIDRETLKRMKAAGCWRVRLGIESGSARVLRFIRKGITLDQAWQVAHWADELGLQPKAFFIIGHLTDTEESIQESIDFARRLPLKDVTVQVNTTLRNSKQYFLAESYGSIVADSTDEYSFWQPMFVPHGLTRSKLDRFHRRFYRRFYRRPSLWWRHLRDIRSWQDISRYWTSITLPLALFFARSGSASHSHDERCPT